jgi:hypothetical protein
MFLRIWIKLHIFARNFTLETPHSLQSITSTVILSWFISKLEVLTLITWLCWCLPHSSSTFLFFYLKIKNLWWGSLDYVNNLILQNFISIYGFLIPLYFSYLLNISMWDSFLTTSHWFLKIFLILIWGWRILCSLADYVILFS